MKKVVTLIFLAVLASSIAQKTTPALYAGTPPTYTTYTDDQEIFSTPQGAAKPNGSDLLGLSHLAELDLEGVERPRDSTGPHEPDKLVIGVQSGRCNELIGLIHGSGAKLVNTISMNGKTAAVVAEISSEVMSSFVADVYAKGLSRYIEPNVKIQLDFTPSDQYWMLQWALPKIKADYAWNATVGNRDLLLAVVDTGIDYDHPDLAASYAALGYDWVNDDPDPIDDHGHGTHCAGIIAAELNNDIGIAGLAQVRIMAEKAFNRFGEGWEDDLANAIVHAVGQGAKIISNSWGSPVESALIHEAISYAYSCGVLIIGAAGNDGSSFKQYPAAYEEVVAVSATNEVDSPTGFTNFGGWIEVAAPGLNILSTFPDDSYSYMSGTSMAAPHAAGVAALIWSQFPWMTCDEVRAQLRYTADDLGALGFDIHYGYGRVNARRAIEQEPPQNDLLIWDWQKPSYIRPGERALINSTVFNYGVSNESNILVQLKVGGNIVDSNQIDFLQSGARSMVRFSWPTTVEGVYNITCSVAPSTGEENTENNVFSGYVTVAAPKVIEVPKDYASIQKAVDAAYPGDTVDVASGTYHEYVIIDKSISLFGEENARAIIDGSGKGSLIQVQAPCVSISGFTVRNGNRGIYVSPFSWNNTIVNNTIIGNSRDGIVLMYSPFNTLRNNNMTGNKFNFNIIGESLSDFTNDIDASNTVDGKPIYYWVQQHDRKIPLDAGYVAVIDSTNILAEGLKLKNNGQGILFSYTRDCVIESVNASSNQWGILLIESSNNRIFNNSMTNNEYSIDLWHCTSNTLRQNNISNGIDGIYFSRSERNEITNNMVTGNARFGVLVQLSAANNFSGNIVSDNVEGLVLAWSGGNALRNNDIVENVYNFGVHGRYLSDFSQNIEASNMINGKPIYYLINQTGLTLDPTLLPNIGYLALVNSTNILVRAVELTNNEQGILFAYTSNSTIEKTSVSENVDGICLQASEDNRILDNTLMNNDNDGVSLDASTSNTVSGNTVTYNGGRGIYIGSSSDITVSNNTIKSNMVCGIQLLHSRGSKVIQNVLLRNVHLGIDIEDFSSDNIICQNDVIENYWGIRLEESSGNKVYRNNFINNTSQVLGISAWLRQSISSAGRKEGNYWSDYAGKDLNGDGIGDTLLPHLSVDYYPLMNPYVSGDVNHDGVVNIIDVAIVASSFHSYPGHPKWNVHADLNGDDIINIFDIATVASNFGNKWGFSKNIGE